MRDKYINECPYCGCTEMAEGYQSGYAAMGGTEYHLGSVAVFHVVCLRCGSIVRSYVKKPEKLIKKKNRKERY